MCCATKLSLSDLTGSSLCISRVTNNYTCPFVQWPWDNLLVRKNTKPYGGLHGLAWLVLPILQLHHLPLPRVLISHWLLSVSRSFHALFCLRNSLESSTLHITFFSLFSCTLPSHLSLDTLPCGSSPWYPPSGWAICVFLIAPTLFLRSTHHCGCYWFSVCFTPRWEVPRE